MGYRYSVVVHNVFKIKWSIFNSRRQMRKILRLKYLILNTLFPFHNVNKMIIWFCPYIPRCVSFKKGIIKRSVISFIL